MGGICDLVWLVMGGALVWGVACMGGVCFGAELVGGARLRAGLVCRVWSLWAGFQQMGVAINQTYSWWAGLLQWERLVIGVGPGCELGVRREWAAVLGLGTERTGPMGHWVCGAPGVWSTMCVRHCVCWPRGVCGSWVCQTALVPGSG